MNLIRQIFCSKITPKIIIKHGRLIDPVFIFYSQNNPDFKRIGWNDWEPPSKKELHERIKSYKEEWAKYNIVEDISKVLNLSFKRNVIDVFIVSGTPRSSSHPIIIKSSFKPQEFVVTLAHELIHRILTINEVPKVIFDERESNTTNNHVIVFAVLKKILSQELWDVEVKLSKSHGTSEYTKAIVLSKEIGSEKIIEMVRAGQVS